jgi:PAS domain S-box-containing protein
LSLGVPGFEWISVRDLIFGMLSGALAASIFLVVASRRRLIAEIARRRAAEITSVASERRFRDFALIASHWLWERDVNARVTYVGGQGTSHVVVTTDGLLTTAGSEIVGAPAIADEQLLALEACIAAREVFADLPLTTVLAPDRRAYVLVSGRPVFDEHGAFAGYRGSTRNVTAEVMARRDRQRTTHQMVQMSEALRLSERRFRDFAEAAGHYMWESDAERRLTFMSDGITRLTGERPEEIVGRRRQDVLVQGTSKDPVGDEIGAIVARREPFMDLPDTRRTKFGTVVHLAISGKPYFSEAGEFLGYRGITRDVTAQVIAQREAEEARRARDFAEASSHAKSEFLANMSHELRTPLNAIMGFSEIIASQLMGPVVIPAYTAYARDIHQSAKRLSNIISDLLDMSRIETGRYAIEPRELVLADLVRDAVAELSDRAITKELSIDISAVDASLRVELDGRAAAQVLANLLSNAIKFTPLHGRIAVTVVPGGDGAVELFVTDSGIGIASDRLEHVFEPFQLSESHHAREEGGAGIGLWLSRSLMRLHGGDLRLDSIEGKGTTATVVVPASRVIDPGRARHVA